MSDNIATTKQVAPHGTGADITNLMKEDVLKEDFLIPSKGLVEVELWLRSAALYLLFRLEPGLAELNKPRATPELAQKLIKALEDRAQMGEAKYGERLKANNGRNPLVDALQECCDGWAYIRQNRENNTTHK